MPWDITDGNRSILSDVQHDVLWHDPRLEFASVWVLASSTEDTRDLHRTVANSLQIAIEECVLHFGGNCGIGFLFNFLLLSSTSVPQLALLLNVLLDMLEVEILQALSAK